MSPRSVLLHVILPVFLVLPSLARAQEERPREPDRDAIRREVLREVEARLEREFQRIRDEVRRMVEERLERRGGEAPPPRPGERAAAPAPWLGVMTGELDDARRDAPGLHGRPGLAIDSVIPASPAEQAGIRAGDVLVEAGGRALRTVEDLRRALREAEVGKAVRIKLLREGKERVVEPVLAPRPQDRPAPTPPAGPAPPGLVEEPRVPAPPGPPRVVRPPEPRGEAVPVAWLGIFMAEAPPEALEEAGADAGVLVAGVVEESPAARAGLEEGDLIVSVGDRMVSGPEALQEAIASRNVGDRVALTCLRDGKKRTVRARLGRRPEEYREPLALEPAPPPAPPPGGPRGDAGRVPERKPNFLGSCLEPPSDAVARQLGLEKDAGLVIVRVGPESLLGALGLKVHDVLLEADGEAVGAGSDLKRLEGRFRKGRQVKVSVLRGGERLDLELEIR